MTLVTMVVSPKVSVHASTIKKPTFLVNLSLTTVDLGKIEANTRLVPSLCIKCTKKKSNVLSLPYTYLVWKLQQFRFWS